MALKLLGISVLLGAGLGYLAYSYRCPGLSTIAGSVVIISGASSGIGAELAVQYGRLGAKLVIAARRLSMLQATADAARAAGSPQVIAVQTDMSDRQQVEHLIATSVESFGYGIDTLILNHASVDDALVSEYNNTEEVERNLRNILSINTAGSVVAAHAALPHLAARAGHIAVVSSASTIAPAPFHSAYVASKQALDGYFRTWRHELALEGSPVTIGIAILGMIGTPEIMKDEGNKWLAIPVSQCASEMICAVQARWRSVFVPHWYAPMTGVLEALGDSAAKEATINFSYIFNVPDYLATPLAGVVESSRRRGLIESRAAVLARLNGLAPDDGALAAEIIAWAATCVTKPLVAVSRTAQSVNAVFPRSDTTLVQLSHSPRGQEFIGQASDPSQMHRSTALAHAAADAVAQREFVLSHLPLLLHRVAGLSGASLDSRGVVSPVAVPSTTVTSPVPERTGFISVSAAESVLRCLLLVEARSGAASLSVSARSGGGGFSGRHVGESPSKEQEDGREGATLDGEPGRRSILQTLGFAASAGGAASTSAAAADFPTAPLAAVAVDRVVTAVRAQLVASALLFPATRALPTSASAATACAIPTAALPSPPLLATGVSSPAAADALRAPVHSCIDLQSGASSGTTSSAPSVAASVGGDLHVPAPTPMSAASSAHPSFRVRSVGGGVTSLVPTTGAAACASFAVLLAPEPARATSRALVGHQRSLSSGSMAGAFGSEFPAAAPFLGGGVFMAVSGLRRANAFQLLPQPEEEEEEGVDGAAGPPPPPPSPPRLAHVTVEDAADSSIFIPAASASAVVRGCSRCTVVLGPCASHVMVEGCDGCTVVVAAHAVTLRNVFDVSVLGWSGSQPALCGEYRGVRLGPYSASYASLGEQAQAALLLGPPLPRCVFMGGALALAASLSRSRRRSSGGSSTGFGGKEDAELEALVASAGAGSDAEAVAPSAASLNWWHRALLVGVNPSGGADMASPGAVVSQDGSTSSSSASSTSSDGASVWGLQLREVDVTLPAQQLALPLPLEAGQPPAAATVQNSVAGDSATALLVSAVAPAEFVPIACPEACAAEAAERADLTASSASSRMLPLPPSFEAALAQRAARARALRQRLASALSAGSAGDAAASSSKLQESPAAPLREAAESEAMQRAVQAAFMEWLLSTEHQQSQGLSSPGRLVDRLRTLVALPRGPFDAGSSLGGTAAKVTVGGEEAALQHSAGGFGLALNAAAAPNRKVASTASVSSFDAKLDAVANC